MKIFGLDEVGRGALAGPLVASAVALNSKSQVPKLQDSKKLSAKEREKLYKLIPENLDPDLSIRLFRAANAIAGDSSYLDFLNFNRAESAIIDFSLVPKYIKRMKLDFKFLVSEGSPRSSAV